MEKKIKRVHRLAPCPAYDVEGLESWLGDLSREGLLLEEDGIFCGVFTFVQAAPRPAKYRLEAVRKRSGIFTEGDEVPSPEARELTEAYGWEYLAKYGDFHIYRSFDPHARELNTDPHVQALALSAVRKRQWVSLIWELIYIAFLAVFSLGKIFFLECLALGTPTMLIMVLLVLWGMVTQLTAFLHLNRLHKKLKASGGMDHQKDWKRRVLSYRAEQCIYLVTVVLFGALLIRGCSNSVMDEGQLPLSDFQGDPPFVTLADLAPGGEYALEDVSYSNTVRQWWDWIAPVNWEWRELARVTTPVGTVSGPLNVYYHETVHPWIARRLAEEYLEKLDNSKLFTWMELPELGVDYALAFSPAPTVILQKGNILAVGTVYAHLVPEGGSLYREWATAMAEEILKHPQFQP